VAKRGPRESIRATRAHRDSACAPKKPRSARCQGRARPPHHRSRSSCSRGPLPPSPPAKKATISNRIMAGGPPFYCPVLGKDRRRGNDRLGAGAYHGSRRRLRHSISAVGTETPSTKQRPLGSGCFQQPIIVITLDQRIFRRFCAAVATSREGHRSPRLVQRHKLRMVNR
jgi:hypothetical protein